MTGSRIAIAALAVLVLSACQTARPVIDATCDLRSVPVSDAIRRDLRRWIADDGSIRADAPQGAEQFIRHLAKNNAVIASRCVTKGSGP